MATLGNIDLLNRYKIGFLAGRKIASLSVLPTLDWAVEIANQEDVAIVSGFHSKIEREVLEFLLRGRCGIVCVLARGIYKRPVEPYIAAFDAGRVLFISNENDSLTRVSKESCRRRNEYVASISDELVLSSVTPESSLQPLTNLPKPIKII